MKDASELYQHDPENFKSAMQALLDNAIHCSTVQQQEIDEQRSEDYEKCKELAGKPDIFKAFASAIEFAGVAGEKIATMLLYLILTSRLFERPLSAVLKATSSAGKSFLVQKVSEFFPERAYYALTGMSERALAYLEEPLEYRILIIFEAGGLQGEFGTYLLRSLLSEGCVKYVVVEKTKDGFKPREIFKPGPTGCVITTTSINIHPENATRMLSIPVSDSTHQTELILKAIANDNEDSVNFEQWHALQRWIASGEIRVKIPFAPALAVLIRPVATRLRRDFTAILTLVKSHALLHQKNRERSQDGGIIAELTDYEAVRGLAAGIISTGIGTTIPDTVRETVQAVAELLDGSDPEETVSKKQIADALGLDPSTIHRRIKAALADGYLENTAPPRRKFKIKLGDPMPDDMDILPNAATVQGHVNSTAQQNTLPEQELGQSVQVCSDTGKDNENIYIECRKLGLDVCEVLERIGILEDSGMPPAEAEQRALDMCLNEKADREGVPGFID